MRRPCAFTAVALITGTVLGNCVELPLPLLLGLVAVSAVALVLLRRKVKLRAALLFAAFAFAGWAHYTLRVPAEEVNSVAAFVAAGPQKVVLVGRVQTSIITIPVGNEDNIFRFDVEVSAFSRETETALVSGKVRVYVNRHEAAPEIEPGNVISTQARLYPLNRVTNPGQTDYSSYYQRHDISARAYIGKNDSIEVLKRTKASWPRRALFAARQRILTGLESAFRGKDQKRGNLLGGLLVGRWTEIDKHTGEIKHKTGTAHFLALSGLHVAIFAFFLWYTLALLPIPRKVRIIIVMAGLVCYCFIGGARISLVRATVMGLLYLGAELFWRQRDTLNIIGAAVVIVILIKPLDVFSLGFQLSFVAVLSIAAFAPLLGQLRTVRGHLLLRLQRPEELTGLDRIRALLSDSFVTWAALSFSAWLGVAPLIAYHFHIVTPFSILINVLISPAIWALLIMGFLTVACSLVAPPAAPVLAFVISLLVGGIHTILELFSSWPLHFYLPNRLLAPVSLPYLVPYYALLAAIAYKLRRRRLKWRYIGIAALVLISLYLIVPWQPRHPPGTKLTALDVGRGSTFVLRTSDGATVLYDCGGGFDKVGRDVIAPYLYHEGATSLEAVILSHPDADHTCALADVLERFCVGAVVVSLYFERNEDGRKILDLARDRGVPVKSVAPGQRFKVGAATFEVLAPLTDEAFGRSLSDNDTSLILRVADAGASFLFTGDAEACETAMLLDSGVNLQAAVLVVPHHGGKNPLVPQLVRRSRARFALISGGRNQAGIVKYLKLLGVTILQTETGGAITLRQHEGVLSAETFLKD